MGRIDYSVGSKFIYNSNAVIIRKILSADTVCIEDFLTNTFETVSINCLQQVNINREAKLETLTNAQYNLAFKRYQIIEPLINSNRKLISVEMIAGQHKISPATIYRWLELFRKSQTVAGLAKVMVSGGKGKSRLTSEVDNIIRESINTLYLNPAKYSITKILTDIKFKCIEKNLKVPCESSTRRRIKQIDEAVRISAREGKKKANEKYSNIISPFEGGYFPLDTVQVDHHEVDLMLVDTVNRRQFKKPNLTLALDVFSRMVIGFYLSFDPPGELGTGICIGNSILSKDKILENYKIEGSWPCWGVMKTLHFDNAKEFHGEMITKATQNYGISIEYRPLRTPHLGGHIESFFYTLESEIHNLPGTTFSNPKEKGIYDSMRRACMTITEFEEWLLIYIVNIYHKRIHSGIKMSPLQKYNKGIADSEIGIGILDKIEDERSLRMNFLPQDIRTIQRYGVLIDHIYYYDEVLNKYINRTDEKQNKRKFIFKKDPRDISIIYFLDPETGDFINIPYRNILNPPMSRWEYKECILDLEKQDAIIDEDSIMEARKRHIRIEQQSIRETKAKRLKSRSRLADERNINFNNVYIKEKDAFDIDLTVKRKDIKPFNDIDYGKFE